MSGPTLQASKKLDIGPDWQPISTAPEGVEVMTKVEPDDWAPRNIQSMVRKGRLWFFPDMSMYVYYTPTHWRSL